MRNLFLLFMVATLALFAAALWCFQDLNATAEHYLHKVSIPFGSTPDETVSRLERAGIIKHGLPLRLYIRAMGLGPAIKAGSYDFASPISPLEALAQLEQGGAPNNKITVVEGWTKFDVADALSAITQFKLSRDKALALVDDPSLIADLDPSAQSLEGYLFPDTYFVDETTKPRALVATMVARFRQVFQKRLSPYLPKAHLSVHEMVTVASIIETEAKLAGERPMVASVIYNRLAQHMSLGMDSTLVYASKLAGAWRDDGKVYQSDVSRKSPYNTYINIGLPPGPVGCPGLNSMQAAVKPAHSKYLYYVRNPDRNDGAHNFYTNEADFTKGVQALRNWEKKR